jgi:zinc-ribbon domain
MYCPQCGHQHTSSESRFCTRCGLPLGLVADLLANGDEQLRREKREITGIALMLATVLMLTNFIIVFGVTTLPHLANPVFLWTWLSFVVSSLAVGGVGLANLIRGDFFKRLKERESRLYLMKAERGRQVLREGSNNSAGVGTEGVPRLVEPASVTETTTRELETIPTVSKREFPVQGRRLGVAAADKDQ